MNPSDGETPLDKGVETTKRGWPWAAIGGVVAGVVVVGIVALAVFNMTGGGATPGTSIANAAPDLTFEVYTGANLTQGATKKLSDFKGKPVVLNFWAGLCPPCRAEMPDFQSVATQYGDQVVFLGVDVGPYVGLGNSQDARKLLNDLGITYPTGLALNSDDIVRYELVGVPSTYFLDATGKVQKKWAGYLPKDEMLTDVQALLKPS